MGALESEVRSPSDEERREESEQIYARVKKARAEVAASEGAKLQSELSAVSSMYKIFATNEQELSAFFHRFTDTTALLALWDVSHSERFEAFLDETARLLHNYLAAAGSLADHTMRVWNEYPPKDDVLIADYERRVAETFRDSPLANFIKGLRNLTLHRRLPVVLGTMSFTAGEDPSLTSVTGLDKKALEQWDGWNASARTYLEAAADPIDLEQVLAEYTAIVHGFNDWFGKAWVSSHLAAFDELARLVAEYNALLPQPL